MSNFKLLFVWKWTIDSDFLTILFTCLMNKRFRMSGLYKKVLYEGNTETIKMVEMASLQTSFPTD